MTTRELAIKLQEDRQGYIDEFIPAEVETDDAGQTFYTARGYEKVINIIDGIISEFIIENEEEDEDEIADYVRNQTMYAFAERTLTIHKLPVKLDINFSKWIVHLIK